MTEKTKYLAVLILSVIVSAATSYVATTSYLATISAPTATVKAADIEALVEQQVAEQLSPKKVTIPYELDFFAGGDSKVIVYSKTTLENLTIEYKYTCLGNGTVITRSIEYGTFIPAWGTGTVIEAGAVPEWYYKIPDDLIEASSTKKVNAAGCLVFDTQPQLEVLEVYGYA